MNASNVKSPPPETRRSTFVNVTARASRSRDALAWSVTLGMVRSISSVCPVSVTNVNQILFLFHLRLTNLA